MRLGPCQTGSTVPPPGRPPMGWDPSERCFSTPCSHPDPHLTHPFSRLPAWRMSLCQQLLSSIVTRQLLESQMRHPTECQRWERPPRNTWCSGPFFRWLPPPLCAARVWLSGVTIPCPCSNPNLRATRDQALWPSSTAIPPDTGLCPRLGLNRQREQSD